MHEHSFVEAIVRNIENRENVKGISLEVGELVGIEAGHLKEHMEEQFDWDIEVLEKESLVRCDCGFEGRPKILERLHDIVVFECPRCSGVPEIVSGDKIRILKVVYN
jgi:Zn finger protein HypA/HybF involved in hydrogenase expression